MLNLKIFQIVLVENSIPLPQIFVEILQSIKKTGLPVKLKRGTCTTCKRSKSLNVSDQTINGKGLVISLYIWVLQPRMLERKYSITQAAHWK